MRRPRLDPNRPTVAMALPLARQIYERHCAGCCLHVVLDDGNLDDECVRLTIASAEHGDCRELAAMLLLMSRTQRAKLSRLI